MFSYVWKGRAPLTQTRLVEERTDDVDTSAIKHYVDEKWKTFVAGGARVFPNDTKPGFHQVVRIESLGPYYAPLVVTSPTMSYQRAVMTGTPEFQREFGEAACPNRLAVTVTLETADGKIVGTVRSEKSDYKPRGFHFSMGGYLGITEGATPYGEALRELEEELGIKEHELQALDVVAAVFNPVFYLTDLVVVAKTTLTSAGVAARKGDDENVGRFFVDSDFGSLWNFFWLAPHAGTASALAGLVELASAKERSRALATGAMNFLDEQRELIVRDPAERARLEARDIAAFHRWLDQHHAR